MLMMIPDSFFSGAKHISYYLCSGEDPSLQGTQTQKFRFIMFLLYIISFLIFIILPFKIWRLKRKIGHEENITLRIDLILMLILMILIYLSGKVDPFEIDKPYNVFLLTFTFMIIPPLTIFTFCIVYFLSVAKIQPKFIIDKLFFMWS